VPWDGMCDELAALAAVLLKFEATERTGQTLIVIQGALENSWRQNRSMSCLDNGIPLPPPRAQGLHPAGCVVEEAEIRFHFVLGDDVSTSRLPARADFQVCVTGHADYGHCVVRLEDHWRVDTHVFDGVPKEPHPFIHFQRGGHSQDGFAASDGFVPGPGLPGRPETFWLSLMQSPGPRVPFPPLCPILSIDFVIGQHDGTVWTQLRSNPEYDQIVRSAQARLWNPFFEGLANADLRRRWLGPIVI
jgi:hypothetical protein